MTFNFRELTSRDLDHIIDVLDALDALETQLVERHVVSGEEVDLVELGEGAMEELTRRAMEDAGFVVNQAVARGEVDRYMRPDGEIGYAPPGAWDEGGADMAAGWEL